MNYVLFALLYLTVSLSCDAKIDTSFSCPSCGSLCQQPSQNTEYSILASVPPINQTFSVPPFTFFFLPGTVSTCLKSYVITGPAECAQSRSLFMKIAVSITRMCDKNRGTAVIPLVQASGFIGDSLENIDLGDYRTCDNDRITTEFSITNLGCEAIGDYILSNIQYSSYCLGGLTGYFGNLSLVDIFQSKHLTISYPFMVKGGSVTVEGSALTVDCNGVLGGLNMFVVESRQQKNIIVTYKLSPPILLTDYTLPLCYVQCEDPVVPRIPDSCTLRSSTAIYKVPNWCMRFMPIIGYRYAPIGIEVNECFQCKEAALGANCITQQESNRGSMRVLEEQNHLSKTQPRMRWLEEGGQEKRQQGEGRNIRIRTWFQDSAEIIP